MPKMSLRELCKELNSPHCSYKENAQYMTAYPFGLPFSLHLMPNQAVADSLTRVVAPELLEIKHGTELVQVAYLKDLDARLAYIGKTENMRAAIRALKLPPLRKGSPSSGDTIFQYFARELERTEMKKAHFEESCPREGKMIMYVLKRLVAVYAAKDALVQVLRNITEKKRANDYALSNATVAGETES